MNKKLTIIILVIIILAGGFFRLWGIDFGLPNQYHPDEAFFINPVFNVIALQSPDWYGAPGTTVIYANSAIFWLTGNIIDSQASTLQLFQENPYYFLLFARIFYALVGTMSILLVYLLAQNLFKKRSLSLLSALTFCLSALHIQHSHYIRPDALTIFFILLAALFASYIYRTGKLKHYILAGLFLVLATITKYPALFAGVFILIGHYLYIKSSSKKFFSKNIFIAGLTSLIFLLAFFPYILTSPIEILKDVVWEARSEHAGADGLGFLGNFEFYITGSLWYIGTLIFVSSIIGMIYAFFKKKKEILFLGSFIIIFIFFISSLALHWDRWILPIVPFGCIFASLGLLAFFKYFKNHFQDKLKLNNKFAYSVLIIICLVIFFYPALLRSFRQSYAFYYDETRDSSTSWVINNLDQDKKATIEDYGPVLTDHFEEIFRPWTIALEFPDYWQEEKQVDYAIVSSWIYDRILVDSNSSQFAKDSYLNLFETRKLIYEATPINPREETIMKNDFELIFSKDIFDFRSEAGPTLKIYEL